MSKILDRAKKHYAGLGVMTHDVPEWPDENGAPLVVHFRAMTPEEYREALPNPARPTHENLVDVVILKAADEKGEKLFDKADKLELMKASDHAIVARIANAIISKTSSVREAVKN